MQITELVSQNFFSPAILFFALGIFAGFLKSDLEIPDSISRYLSIYLMMSIGFKGGVSISNTEDLNILVFYLISAAIIFGFIEPFISFFILRITTKLDVPTAAAVAAHYGSISMVTFVTSCSFLRANQIAYEGYIIAILALMEAPAIISGLFIAHKLAPETASHKKEDKKLCFDIFTNGAILLLLGSFIVGVITGSHGMNQVEGFLVLPFHGILCLFLLDMGLIVAKNLHSLKKFTFPLFLFGLYMPLIGAFIGLIISKLIGLNVGTGTLFMVMCGSASYIAVPAAIRLSLPEANPSIYLPMSLGITFPFNILFGIPIYYSLATRFLGS